MNFVKKAAALCLAAVLAGSLAACGQQATWVAKYDEVTVPAGVYIDELINALSQVSADLGADVKEPLKEQIDGTPVPEKVTADARKALDEYIAVEKKFDEMGLTLSEENTLTIDQNVSFFWPYIKDTYQANGISESSYRLVVTNETKANAIFQAIYGEGGSEEVPESELKTKFENDVAKVIMIPLSFSTDEDAAKKEEADKKTRETMDKFYQELQDGASMDDVYYEARKLASGDENLERPEPGTYFTFVNREGGAYEQNVTDAIFSAKLGEPVKVETADSAYLFVRYDVNETPADFTSRKDSLLVSLKQDAFNQKRDEWVAALTGVTYNDAALKRYTPSKLKLS